MEIIELSSSDPLSQIAQRESSKGLKWPGSRCGVDTDHPTQFTGYYSQLRAMTPIRWRGIYSRRGVVADPGVWCSVTWGVRSHMKPLLTRAARNRATCPLSGPFLALSMQSSPKRSLQLRRFILFKGRDLPQPANNVVPTGTS
jgi:hypothetical protein